MTDDSFEQLERHASEPVPTPDQGFLDRLESDLRVQHADQAPARRRIAGLLPRVGVAFAVVLIGVVGALVFSGRDAGVPVSVIDDDPIAPVDQPSIDTGGVEPNDEESKNPSEAVVVPPTAQTPTATATPMATGTPTPTVVDTESNTADGSAGGPEATAEATPTEAPLSTSASATSTPVPTATPQPAAPIPTPTVTPASTATPTPPAPLSTPEPPPTPTVLPSPTPTPTPTTQPTPTPTPAAEPVVMGLTCQVRVAESAVGVVCRWDAAPVDAEVTHYELWRSRNGGDAQVIARQRAAAPTTYVDRDVAFGDEVTYLIRALVSQGQSNDDTVAAESVRQVVQVPAS